MGFSSVIEGVSSEAEWTIGFSLVTEGVVLKV
jgi:hypothetical protein